MKKLYALFPLAAILLTSSCKKKDPVAVPEIPEVITKSSFVPDSTSFTINGKRYINAQYPTAGRGYGNRGVNLQLSTTNGEWSITAGADTYWVGEADSVQYASYSTTMLSNFQDKIEVAFIKKYSKENALKLGTMYFPQRGEKFYTLSDYPYPVDFGRTGKDEGVALNLYVNGETLTSYSQLAMKDKSQLTAKSQGNSKFKIIKLEEIKETNFVIIEATFDAVLFDKKENPVKVTDGYFRITTQKNGVKMDPTI